jgi:hypothetical protein
MIKGPQLIPRNPIKIDDSKIPDNKALIHCHKNFRPLSEKDKLGNPKAQITLNLWKICSS